jgi:hypothetical protein
VTERRQPAEGGKAHSEVDSTQQDDFSYQVDEYAAGEGTSAQLMPFRRAEDEDDDTDRSDLVDLDELDDPVDLTAVQSDDALLDALGGTNPDVPDLNGDQAPELESLLVALRRDVDAAPIGDLVDMDTAVAAIAEGRRPRRLHRRHLVPVATAAAVLMIAFTGVGLAARDALPGDMLWGVAQVLYTDHARVVQAATSARIELANANAAFLQGDRVAAEAALKRAQEQMESVDAEHGLAQLKSAQASLAAKFAGNDGTSATSTWSSRQRSIQSTSTTPSSPAPMQPPATSTPPSSSSSSTQPTQSSTTSTSITESSQRPSTTGGTGLFGSHP